MSDAAIKNRVKNLFGKAEKTYDQYCSIQNRICKETILLLSKSLKISKHNLQDLHYLQFRTIADFGCGTGESTRKLLQYIQCEACYGLDLSLALLNRAKKKNIETHFFAADIDQLPLQQNSVDLIFSNMALQWTPNFHHSIKHIYQHLKPNGIVAFSLPINDNFPELLPNFKLAVPSHETIINTLNALEYDLLGNSVKILIESFSSQLEAIRSLKKVGANHNNRTIGLSKSSIRRAFAHPTHSQLSYEIGMYVARKSTK